MVETPMSPIFRYSLSLKQNSLEIERRHSKGRPISSGRYPHELQPLSRRPPNLLANSHKRRTFEICVQNLTYKVIVKSDSGQKQERVLLDKINAEARNGEILGIFGHSGSGKSTLLDALAGRIDRRSLEGAILVNGKPIDNKFKRVSGYVTQDDALLPLLTVKETLMFSARLRLPETIPFRELQGRVERVIESLGLGSCANTYIGNEEVRGVSGGEKRRVSIGVEVIHDPSVLLLDEPTHGLESASALQVMEHLLTIATNGRTVVLSMHQPSYVMLELISNCLVLVQGNVVYHGSQKGMLDFYEDLGYNMPDHMTVVEYILESARKITTTQGLQKLVEFYNDSRILTKDEQIVVHPKLDQPISCATSFLNQTSVLAERNLIKIVRTKQLFIARSSMMAVAALIIGSLFFRTGRNEIGIQERQSFIIFAQAFLLFTATESLPRVLSERQTFLRETDRGAYHTSAYVLSSALVVLPFNFFLAMVFSCVAYWTVGLANTPSAIAFFMLMTFVTLSVATSLVSVVGSLIPNLILANNFLLVFLSFTLLFSGFFLPRINIPGFWFWIHYISPFKYPYEALMYNEFSHLPGVVWFDSEDTMDVLAKLGLAGVNPWRNLGIMGLMWFVYNALFYFALRFNAKLTRK